VHKKIGDLNCIVIDNCDDPELVVIILHGFGADADNLAGIGESILESVSFKKIRTIFPYAPIELSQGSYAWWNLNIQEIINNYRNGDIDQVVNEIPEGLQEAREKISSLIQIVQTETGLGIDKFILGGFSQGAMLSVETMLHTEGFFKGICVFSGSLINAQKWTELAPSKKGQKIIQSHGTRDPIIPFVIGSRLKLLLESNGMDLDFLKFEGQHTIPQSGLSKLILLCNS